MSIDRDLDAFLAECDDVITDWEGNGDSATWRADGSHQPDRIDGDYYIHDRVPRHRDHTIPAADLLRELNDRRPGWAQYFAGTHRPIDDPAPSAPVGQGWRGPSARLFIYDEVDDLQAPTAGELARAVAGHLPTDMVTIPIYEGGDYQARVDPLLETARYTTMRIPRYQEPLYRSGMVSQARRARMHYAMGLTADGRQTLSITGFSDG